MMNPDHRPSSDMDLLRAARRLDMDALTEIYERFNPQLYTYAIRLLGEASIADACIAETFSAFLTSLHTRQAPEDHLQAYLYRLAHTWICDHYRLPPQQTGRHDETFSAKRVNTTPLVAGLHILQARARLALFELTPEQRQVITLKYLEELDYEEIAAALATSVDAVIDLQALALDSLKTLLHDEATTIREDLPDIEHDTLSPKTEKILDALRRFNPPRNSLAIIRDRQLFLAQAAELHGGEPLPPQEQHFSIRQVFSIFKSNKK